LRGEPTASGCRIAERSRSLITAVDSNLAVTFQAVSEQLRVLYIREKLLAVLAAFFGALALLLSAIGLYAVLSYSVTLRRSEIKIRMALGADRVRVMRLVLGNVAVLMAVGLTLGAIASVWLVGLVKALVHETQPRDPLTFAAAGSILVLVCAVAAWVPAWRAARTAPSVVLRRL
jgi:ABC-type antimicrobial peptide transport system permease subunit